MNLLERLDMHFDAQGHCDIKTFHLTRQMADQLVREEVAAWQEADDPALPLMFRVDLETGQTYYRGIPIKIVGTGYIPD